MTNGVKIGSVYVRANILIIWDRERQFRRHEGELKTIILIFIGTHNSKKSYILGNIQ